jgi:23S rRNA pseudouridine2605 synthase
VLAQPKRTQLNRALSKLGLCSRGTAGTWIAEGRVKVNGKRAESPEQWVELGVDRIEVTGMEPPAASASGPRIYLALHKPAGYVTTRSDELGRKTVYGLLPPDLKEAWLFPVGRLDKDSEGLLLMTNDGEWSDLLTDPGFHVEKIYRVKLDGRPLEAELERFRSGIELDGSRTLPAAVDAEGKGWYRVGLTEGRNRQIRRMFHALGYKVKRLVRVSIGPLELGDLEPGAIRDLDRAWAERLREAAKGKGSAKRRP